MRRKKKGVPNCAALGQAGLIGTEWEKSQLSVASTFDTNLTFFAAICFNSLSSSAIDLTKSGAVGFLRLRNRRLQLIHNSPMTKLHIFCGNVSVYNKKKPGSQLGHGLN